MCCISPLAAAKHESSSGANSVILSSPPNALATVVITTLALAAIASAIGGGLVAGGHVRVPFANAQIAGVVAGVGSVVGLLALAHVLRTDARRALITALILVSLSAALAGGAHLSGRAHLPGVNQTVITVGTGACATVVPLALLQASTKNVKVMLATVLALAAISAAAAGGLHVAGKISLPISVRNAGLAAGVLGTAGTVGWFCAARENPRMALITTLAVLSLGGAAAGGLHSVGVMKIPSLGATTAAVGTGVLGAVGVASLMKTLSECKK